MRGDSPRSFILPAGTRNSATQWPKRFREVADNQTKEKIKTRSNTRKNAIANKDKNDDDDDDDDDGDFGENRLLFQEQGARTSGWNVKVPRRELP